MSDIDLSGIDATKPEAGAATTSAVRANFAAVLAALETAKSEIEALEAAGGGGDTVTRQTIASLASGESALVTHPEEPLDDTEQLSAAVWALIPGASDQSVSVYCDEDPYITFDDLNKSGLSWIRDGANVGHFSGSVDPGVQVPCKVVIDGSTYWIKELLNDGSNASDVTLSSDAPTGAVDRIVAFTESGNGYQLINYPDSGGTYRNPKDYWYTFEFAQNREGWGEGYPSGADVASWGSLTGCYLNYNNSYHMYPNAYTRWVLSPDEGSTWYYYDGSAWIEFDGDVTNGEHWASAPTISGNPAQGCVGKTSSSLWSSDGTTQVGTDEAILAAMPKPAGEATFLVRGAVIVDSDGTYDSPYGKGWSWIYDEADYRRKTAPGYSGEYSNEGEIELRRSSSTELRVTNLTDETLTDIVVVIRTP